MNLMTQIELITVPQDFTRLCNAVLQAEHGTDFLPIDDDRADRGNDGYLKSEKRIFAAHCFKRIQNQRIDHEIRAKMMGDLRKAIQLKMEGDWDIEAWTFLSNYPIPENIARQVIVTGKESGIDVSWNGPGYFAEVLQRFRSVREMFPNLLGNDILDQLDAITAKLESLSVAEPVINWVPRNAQEQRALISQKPPAWEYLLFAGILRQRKEILEPKWRDYLVGNGSRTGRYLDKGAARIYLHGIWSDVESIAERVISAFDERLQLEAFGAPGEPGNAELIKHSADRIVKSYEDLLDWAGEIRGTVLPEDMKRAFDAAAMVAAQPVADIRTFIDQTVTAIDEIPARLAQENPRPIIFTLTLTLTINEAAMAEFRKEARRLRW
ncbi:hypothetical protein [Streptomyces hygroscopicus]|uniref:hypothetical protein n=1 Tax=Streptomyces hygroscopicus TaxID=1912 RepID=UPI00223E9C91|nr:hypothetical protein [Streptomyces hygroscopicus]